MAVLFKKVFLQTAPVHANADRNMVRLAAVGDGLDPFLAPDVSGVDADFGSAVFRCLDGEPVVKVNVGNKRQGEASQILPKASAACISGTASRAISQPAAASSRIWRKEPSTSVVFVFSIDWMETGAPPPILTLPTVICFVIRITPLCE